MHDRPLDRREFLRGLGVAISLPFFPSLSPRSAWAWSDGVKPPTRLLFVCVPLGFVPNKSLFDCPLFEQAGNKGWFPEDDGPLTRMPEVHAGLEPYREHVSFLKGLCNRKYRGDVHFAENAFLTCADTLVDPTRSFSNTVSCDQVAAGAAGMGCDAVRYRSLELGAKTFWGSRTGGLAWGGNGAPIGAVHSPAQLFDKLFGKDDLPAEARLLRLKQKRSVLDVTLGQIKDLDRRLDAADRGKLDEITTAVRGVEASIQRDELWLDIAKPAAPFARPAERVLPTSSEHPRLMFDLVHAAFVTDSTRVATYQMPPSFTEVSSADKHLLNHDLSPKTAAEAIQLDRAMSEEIASFTGKLCDSKEADGQPLIHHTLAAYGAAEWGAHHSLRCLPIMLLGHGGGRIAQGMTRRYAEGTPLANLWLTMLTAAGATAPGDAFADSTGTLAGLL